VSAERKKCCIEFIKDDDGWRYRLSSRKDVAAAAVALQDELPELVAMLIDAGDLTEDDIEGAEAEREAAEVGD
jgi:hypothetical protein